MLDSESTGSDQTFALAQVRGMRSGNSANHANKQPLGLTIPRTNQAGPRTQSWNNAVHPVDDYSNAHLMVLDTQSHAGRPARDGMPQARSNSLSLPSRHEVGDRGYAAPGALPLMTGGSQKDVYTQTNFNRGVTRPVARGPPADGTVTLAMPQPSGIGDGRGVFGGDSAFTPMKSGSNAQAMLRNAQANRGHDAEGEEGEGLRRNLSVGKTALINTVSIYTHSNSNSNHNSIPHMYDESDLCTMSATNLPHTGCTGDAAQAAPNRPPAHEPSTKYAAPSPIAGNGADLPGVYSPAGNLDSLESSPCHSPRSHSHPRSQRRARAVGTSTSKGMSAAQAQDSPHSLSISIQTDPIPRLATSVEKTSPKVGAHAAGDDWARRHGSAGDMGSGDRRQSVSERRPSLGNGYGYGDVGGIGGASGGRLQREASTGTVPTGAWGADTFVTPVSKLPSDSVSHTTSKFGGNGLSHSKTSSDDSMSQESKTRATSTTQRKLDKFLGGMLDEYGEVAKDICDNIRAYVDEQMRELAGEDDERRGATTRKLSDCLVCKVPEHVRDHIIVVCSSMDDVSLSLHVLPSVLACAVRASRIVWLDTCGTSTHEYLHACTHRRTHTPCGRCNTSCGPCTRRAALMAPQRPPSSSPLDSRHPASGRRPLSSQT